MGLLENQTMPSLRDVLVAHDCVLCTFSNRSPQSWASRVVQTGHNDMYNLDEGLVVSCMGLFLRKNSVGLFYCLNTLGQHLSSL